MSVDSLLLMHEFRIEEKGGPIGNTYSSSTFLSM
jgi:hypothetical protein